MKDTTTITDKFQITILKSVRNQLGWKIGDLLKVQRKNGGLLLTKVDKE
ncbi:MAG: AbrB/MazE/SpoVT family DNA-binding domain-containing protein [bacterium]